MLRHMTVRVLVALLLGSVLASCRTHSQDGSNPSAVGGERCAQGFPSGAATTDVVLSDRLPWPAVTVAPGDTVTVRVSSDADVTEPQAANPRVACRLSVNLSGHTGTAVFVARSAGSTHVGATITGVAGGLNHPAYGATLVVK